MCRADWQEVGGGRLGNLSFFNVVASGHVSSFSVGLQASSGRAAQGFISAFGPVEHRSVAIGLSLTPNLRKQQYISPLWLKLFPGLKDMKLPSFAFFLKAWSWPSWALLGRCRGPSWSLPSFLPDLPSHNLIHRPSLLIILLHLLCCSPASPVNLGAVFPCASAVLEHSFIGPGLFPSFFARQLSMICTACWTDPNVGVDTDAARIRGPWRPRT